MRKALGVFISVIFIGGSLFTGFLVYKTVTDDSVKASSAASESFVNEDKAKELCKDYLRKHYNLTDSSMMDITVNGNDNELYCVTFNYIRKRGRIEPVFVLTVDKFTGRISNCIEESGYFYIVKRLQERHTKEDSDVKVQ